MRQLKRIKDALETLIAACPGRGALGCCSIMEALEGHEEAGNRRARTARSKSKRP